MSSDTMIICEEDDSTYEGKGTNKAIFIDECSMGEPWHDFGKWFGERYSGHPSMIEQIHGWKEHSYKEFTEEDLVAVKMAMENRECHNDMNKNEVLAYLKARIGKHISTENW